MKRASRIAIIAFAIIGVVLSLLTIDLHIRLELDPGLAPSYCHITEKLNCAPVIGSRYSTLFGVPLGSYGIFYYVVMVGLALLNGGLIGRRSVVSSSPLLTLASVSVVLSVILFLVSEFVIHAICPVCLAMYAVNVGIAISAWTLERERGFIRSLGEGTTQLFVFPLVVLGIKKPAQSGGHVIARASTVPALVLACALYLLPLLLYSRLIKSPEFLAREDAAIENAVELWKKAPVQQIAIATKSGFLSDYTRGSEGAPITIVEFSDYECPACRRLYDRLEPLLESYSKFILFVHKNFPIDDSCNPLITHKAHEFACQAALFARCAGEQGKFWEANRFLFTLPELESGDPAQFQEGLARGIDKFSLDGVGMKACIASERQLAKIKEDVTLADTLALEGTPSLWVNGKRVSTPHEAVLRKIFESILTERVAPVAP